MSGRLLNSHERHTRWQCSALHLDGTRCKKSAIATEDYHGDNEIYDYSNGRPTWVRVYFCRVHTTAGLASAANK